jgi:uncharacterized phage protein gp47/JayE
MAFNRPTLSDLVTRIEGDLVSRLQIVSTVLRRAVVRIIARVIAGATHGLHGYLEWASRQLFVSSADADQLDRHGADIGVSRKLATYANGNVTLSGTNGTTIPASTRLQRSDGVTYSITSGGIIAGGVATLAVKALVAGVDGNAAAAAALSMVSPIAGINSAAAVAAGGLVNGIDTENDENYRTRILQRKRNPPHGGSVADFEAWALEVAGVTRAWVFANYGGLGNVGITFVQDNEPGIIPISGKVSELQAYIDDSSRRPVASSAVVYAPTAVPLNLSITLTPNSAPVRAAVTAELQDLLYRDGEPESTLLLSHINAAISNAAGETNHVLTVPTADQTYSQTQIPVLGVITFS